MKARATDRTDDHGFLIERLLNLSDRRLSLFMLLLAGVICTALMLVDRSFFG